MPVRIVTDSACDLPPEPCDELGIEVVPLTIRFGDEEYVDRKELSTDDVLARARDVAGAARDRGAVGRCVRGDVPPARRRRRRRHRLHQPLRAAVGDDAVGAGRGQGARRRVPDRRSSTRRARRWASATSCCTPRAARADGADLDDDRRARSKTGATASTLLAALDTLEYLRKGGRIGGAQAMLGSMLSIKPIISVVDGAVERGRARSAPARKALRFLVDQVPGAQRRDDQRAARGCARHRRVPRAARARGARTPRSSSARSAR